MFQKKLRAILGEVWSHYVLMSPYKMRQRVVTNVKMSFYIIIINEMTEDLFSLKDCLITLIGTPEINYAVQIPSPPPW